MTDETTRKVSTVRDKRLLSEFNEMLALRRPGGLIDFQCAPLSPSERIAVASRSALPADVMRGFLSVDDFQRRYPGRSPDKYRVILRCRGVARFHEVKRAFGTERPTPGLPQPFVDDDLVMLEDHKFEAIFPLQYPEALPHFIWRTPIFHPNIRGYNLCTTGRPFASGTRLADICRMAGQMVQYRNFNTESYLDSEARDWAIKNRRTGRLPIDSRPLVGAAHEGLIIFVDATSDLAVRSEQSGPGQQRTMVEWV